MKRGFGVVYPVQVNGVFVQLPRQRRRTLDVLFRHNRR